MSGQTPLGALGAVRNGQSRMGLTKIGKITGWASGEGSACLWWA